MPVVAAVMTTVGVGVGVESAKQQKEATKEQVRAQKAQQRQQKRLADIKATRERRRMAREARKARADLNVATRGTGDSRAAGVGGSVATQAASAAGFMGQQQQVGQTIFDQGLRASQASADIAGAQATGQIGGAITSLTSTGYGIWKDLKD